jgi:hypothetical protein
LKNPRFIRIFAEKRRVMSKYINPYNEYEQSRLNYLEVKEAVNTAEMDGRKKREYEIAREMKIAGEPKDKIKKYTGLTFKEIDKI